MKEPDICYLCTTIGNLSGVPVRIFEKEELIFFYSQANLPRDPMAVCRKEIFAVHSHIGYITTRHFHFYGIVNSGETKIVIGPTRQIAESDQELRELAFLADVSEEDTAAFLAGMKSIVRMPFESILQMLCTINHVLNGEKLSLKDIAICEADQEKLTMYQGRQQAERKLSPLVSEPQSVHNTFDQEQALLSIVRKGDTAALRKWFSAAPAIRGGILAKEQLRQQKNMFIVTVTLVSRAAIQGGMAADDAFSYSDSYIQQCELLSSPEAITNLQYRMILDYTERIERLRFGKQPAKLTLDVANYIQHHMSETITAEKIAKELFLSRPYLSRKFKEETGESLTDFILKEKTEEAKRLLRYSDKSLTAISNYLGFSSPSHFSRVFKTYTGYIPREYRGKYT
ncbi:MAG: helix-turn-helix domain-containing protein [Eubacteriales bacterium]|nr:helix-turn-helix domain-containing protein [Eubacteriales bacterium]